MEMTLKALYNSLRISIVHNPHIAAAPWQVENYRTLSLEDLLGRLQQREVFLDKASFIAYANEYDSPEELLDALISEDQTDTEESDQAYLLIFELWRRLVPEKQSPSIICDELDYQIFLFDSGTLERPELLENALTSFYSILIENLDNGLSESEVFSAVSEYCANDISSFLYDYISDLIDQQEYSYAMELVEQFYSFVPDKFWMDFLNARLVGVHNTRQAHLRIRKLLQEMDGEAELALNLDILSYLSHGLDRELFKEIAIQSIPYMENEDDLRDLCRVTVDFFESCGDKNSQKQIEDLLLRREDNDRESALAQQDPDIELFRKTLG